VGKIYIPQKLVGMAAGSPKKGLLVRNCAQQDMTIVLVLTFWGSNLAAFLHKNQH
jgi:hypothetical protein